MTQVHHTAVCTGDVEASLRFWRDGLGFVEVMDLAFEGDWPTLFDAPGSRLRSVFLARSAAPEDQHAGLLELVDLDPDRDPDADPTPDREPVDLLGVEAPRRSTGSRPGGGFLLVSVYVGGGDGVDRALARLAELGLADDPRRITVHGVVMATVLDPNGVRVELIGVDP